MIIPLSFHLRLFAKMNLNRLLCRVTLLLLAMPSAHATQLLPGVYGYGLDRTANPAGFITVPANGNVVRVINLADSGTGSLREAVKNNTTTPRVVIFDVSGAIDLKTPLTIYNSNLTIAGQTAPDSGIALHGAGILVRASNVLIQHLRVRPGDRWASTLTGYATTNRDAVAIDGGGPTAPTITNVVFDHCTFSWSLDEMSSLWNNWDNITFNKCLFAEPLHTSIHLDEGTFVNTEVTGTNKNYPWQVEKLVAPTTSNPTLQGTSVALDDSASAVNGKYQRVTAAANGDYIEYTVPIIKRVSSASPPVDLPRTQMHLVVVGITGTNRAKYQVQVYNASGTSLIWNGAGTNPETVDQSLNPGTQQTYVSQQTTPSGFTLPAGTSAIRVRFIFSGRTPTNNTLGIDQISLSEPHGMGPLWGAGKSNGAPAELVAEGKLSVIGSVIAHLADRGPWSAAQQFYFTNNVLYNRSFKFVKLGYANYWDVPMNAAVIGNTFIEGSSLGTGGNPQPLIINEGLVAGSKVYVGDLADNGDLSYNPGDLGGRAHAKLYSPSIAPPLPPNPAGEFYSEADLTPKNAGFAGFVPLRHFEAFQDVLASVGARPAERDSMELRVIQEISDGAEEDITSRRPGKLKNSVADAGGWPNHPQNTEVLDLPTNPTFDDDSDGYTNLEEWLHDLSAQVETLPTSSTDTFTTDVAGTSPLHWVVDTAAAVYNDAAPPSNWRVSSDASSGMVLQQSSLADDSPIYRIGTNWSGNQSVEAKVKITGVDGVNRLARVYSRYQDVNHAYYVTVRIPTTPSSTTPTIELKKINGVGNFPTLNKAWDFPIVTGVWYKVKLSVVKTSPTAVLLTATVTNVSNGTSKVLTYTDVQSSTNPIYTLGSAAIGTYKARADFDDITVTP